MRTSMERLLSEAIDYAGQFPPASLDLPEALDNYQRFRRNRERWIVGRFVCAANRLAPLARALPPTGPEFEVAVVASAGPVTAQDWENTLEADVASLNDFIELAPDYADVVTYEVRLPSDLEVERALRDLNGLRDVDVYVEIPADLDVDETLAAIAETQWIQAKLRTGGTLAAAFPDAARVAAFLMGCIDLDVPSKLTAGLHHALPTWSDPIGVRQHGFLSVFGGAAIARANDLSRRELERLLMDDDASAWSFADDGFQWRGHEASLDDIDEARAILRSFGSCSVDEPLEELANFTDSEPEVS